MKKTELLLVQQAFQLQGMGLTVLPDFSVPKAGWRNGAHRVRIVKPDGEELEAEAHFRVSHFKLIDPSAPLDKRWRVVISFPSLREDDLPVGSIILCDPAVAVRLLP
jgi:hypothetical protein